MSTLTTPLVKVSLAIQPSEFSIGENCALTITAVNESSEPITVYTWPTIFNLELAQKRKNFYCIDADTADSVTLEIAKGGKRSGFVSFERGGKDDAHFQTLEPKVPTAFTAPFQLAKRTYDDGSGISPAHRYKFGVAEGEQIARWWMGRKEDIMASSGSSGVPAPESSGDPIRMEGIEAIEFSVKG